MEKAPNTIANNQETESLKTYKIERSEIEISNIKADLYKVGFGSPAQNDQIVRDAELALSSIFDKTEEDLGPVTRKADGIALVNGPASLPVAVVVANSLLQRYSTVAVFDPKLNGYVVSATHDASMPLGTIITA